MILRKAFSKSVVRRVFSISVSALLVSFAACACSPGGGDNNTGSNNGGNGGGTSSASAKPELTLGTFQNGVYENPYFGFKINIPSNWHIATQDEIDQINQVGNDPSITATSLTQTPENLAKQKLLSLIYAFKNEFANVKAGETNAGLQVVAENLTVSGTPQAAEADYLDSIKQQIGGDVGYVSEPAATRTIGSAAFTVLKAANSQSGLDMAFYCKKVGDYMLTVITTCPRGDADAQALLERSVASIALKE